MPLRRQPAVEARLREELALGGLRSGRWRGEIGFDAIRRRRAVALHRSDLPLLANEAVLVETLGSADRQGDGE